MLMTTMTTTNTITTTTTMLTTMAIDSTMFTLRCSRTQLKLYVFDYFF